MGCQAPGPPGRADHVAAVVNNSAGEPVLYVVGGVNQLDQAGLPVEAFNYATNSWQRKQTSGGPVQSNGVGVIGGKLYISGGVSEHGDGLEADNTLVVYDPVRDGFTLQGEHAPAHQQWGEWVIGGRLYVLVGFCSDCTPASITALSLQSRHRHLEHLPVLGAPPPRTRRGRCDQGQVLCGRWERNRPGGAGTTNLDVYDPATNKWKTLARLPSAILAAPAP